MAASAKLICLIVALVLFALAGLFGWFRPGESRVNIVALGLFFWALSDALS